MINTGEDSGSWLEEAYEIIQKHGAPTWEVWPYETSGPTAYGQWPGDPEVWRNALNYRMGDLHKLENLNTVDGLEALKQKLSEGVIFNIATFISAWEKWTDGVQDNPNTADDDEYVGDTIVSGINGYYGGHAMTIVGYNDNLWIDINGDGKVQNNELGALKIANSWGSWWENSGFVWIAYDAVLGNNDEQHVFYDNYAFYTDARATYSPEYVAEFTINCPKRSSLYTSLGVGGVESSDPESIFEPAGLSGDGGGFDFMGRVSEGFDGTFVLDYTDLLTDGTNFQRYFLGIKNISTREPIDIKDFKLINCTTGEEWLGLQDYPISLESGEKYFYIDKIAQPENMHSATFLLGKGCASLHGDLFQKISEGGYSSSVTAEGLPGFNFKNWTLPDGTIFSKNNKVIIKNILDDVNIYANFEEGHNPDKIVFVDIDATGTNSGESWSDAYTDLQQAINDLAKLPGGGEVWVAEGVYKPGEFRDDYFAMKDFVAVYGGFSGKEVTRDERDINAHEVILSGDVDGDGTITNNAYHVIVNAEKIGNSSVLDGVTIAYGNADSDTVPDGIPSEEGGGCYNLQCDPVFVNCTFRDNYAIYQGGAFSCYVSNSKFYNCKFINNSSKEYAGAIEVFVGSPNFIDCEFSGNSSETGGSADIWYSTVKMDNITFSDNNGVSEGGGISLTMADLMLINGVFNGNHADEGAGVNVYGGGLKLYNTTFYNNYNDLGGGLSFWGNSKGEIVNSILWKNSDQGEGIDEILTHDSVITAQNSNIMTSGGSAGWLLEKVTDNGGNIDTDPAFFDTDNLPGNDATMGTTDDGLRLTATSLCIDAGDDSQVNDTYDISGNLRIQGNAVDMGAFEGILNSDTLYSLTVVDGSGSGKFVENSMVKLSSIEIVGKHFVNWTSTDGEFIDANSHETTFTMPALDVTVTANYEYDTFDVTYIADKGGSIDGNPNQKIDYGGDSETVTAVPLPGCGFLYWSDGLETPERSEADVKEDISLTAYFSVTWFVDIDAVGNNDGSSWENAFTDLNAAIAFATEGDQIWVAEGTYLPGNTRDSCFSLKNKLAVYGGFAGTETELSERKLSEHHTILSADIGTAGDNSDNCYHVLKLNKIDNSSVLDGFIITGGNADGNYPDNIGGGIYSESASLILRNCAIVKNSAGVGGGIANRFSSSPLIINTLIAENTALAKAGGILCEGDSSPEIINCTVLNNLGGTSHAMHSMVGSHPFIKNSIFWNSSVNNSNYITRDISSLPFFANSDICGSRGSDDWRTAYGSDSGENIDQDPSFSDFNDLDGADDILLTEDDGFILNPDSLCRNTGKNEYNQSESDILGNNRIFETIDMGASELQGMPPTLTAFSYQVGVTVENAEVNISYAMLMSKGDESDPDGEVVAFVVKEVFNGSLKIGADSDSALPWELGVNDVIDADHIAFWTPAVGVSGLSDAFAVVAKDNSDLESETPVPAQIIINSNDINLTFSHTGSGSTNPDGLITVDPTEFPVTVSAAPATGYVFSKWIVISGDAVIADPLLSDTTVNTASVHSEIGAEFVEKAVLIELSQTEINEKNGKVTATITRNGDISVPLSVILKTDISGQVTMPGTVAIKAGESSAECEISAVDNSIKDGSRIVTITASTSGFSSSNAELKIVDDENIPPVAVDDSYNAVINKVLVISADRGVLKNDYDEDDDSMTTQIVSEPEHGTVEFNTDGSFTYTPDADFLDTDSFTYMITDGFEDSNTASVSIKMVYQQITIGSSVTVTPEDIGVKSFDKIPKIYGLANGKKAGLKKDKTSNASAAKGFWSKALRLYNKKAVKSGYANAINGKQKPLVVQLKVKGKIGGMKKDVNAYKVTLVAPLITSYEIKGTTINVKGYFFGSKAPKIAFEPVSGGKLAKCKVNKAAYTFNPVTGESKVSAVFRPEKLQGHEFNLVLDNKVGIGVDSEGNMIIIDTQAK
jgi:hypothetical protein